MIRQLPNLPAHLDQARIQGAAPWTNELRKDFHVVVFEDEGECLYFVPQYATVSLIQDCFADALDEGMRKVENGEWESFNINFKYINSDIQSAQWPYVCLTAEKKHEQLPE